MSEEAKTIFGPEYQIAKLKEKLDAEYNLSQRLSQQNEILKRAVEKIAEKPLSSRQTMLIGRQALADCEKVK